MERVLDRVRTAGSITVLTGAGVSVAGGIPTFRGEDGLWNEYNPRDLATPEAFRKDPETVWEWYEWRRQKIAAASPNPAHQVLARWSQRWDNFRLITQNVDGLHEAAGTRHVIRLHGTIWHLSCWDGCSASPDAWENRQVPLEPLPPTCPHCGGLARPRVVWFGEGLDSRVLDAARGVLSCDVFFSIGTSAQVYPAAGFLEQAQQQGAFCVEINPEPTSSSNRLDAVIDAPAEECLPEMDEALRLP